MSNSEIILKRDYFQKDEKGNLLENSTDFFHRIAHTIALIDRIYNITDISKAENEFFSILNDMDFLPNSPTLKNAGLENGQLSACFVLPIEDSIAAIYDTLSKAALIQKNGGGTGFSFSKVRCNNDTISHNQGFSSGPVSFIKVFDASTNAIKQGGIRRGANIAILDINHPDIEEFIHCKDDEKNLTNFNISVGVTKEFVDAVKSNENINLINPRNNSVVKTISANYLFNLIASSAHDHGEPGIIFFDNVEKDNPLHEMENITATNPCGEQPLLDNESCNLGSINLLHMCRKNASDNWEINWEKLTNVVHIAVHFLDNVIDANHYPLEIIESKTKSTRKIGLGVMGWADTLLRLMIPYDSEDAIKLAKKIMKHIKDEAIKASKNLAFARKPFPLHANSTRKNFRNATLTTIAPTGTLSIIAGCSSGIEPLYSLAYTKHLADGSNFEFFSQELLNALEKLELNNMEDIINEIKKTGSIANMESLPIEIRAVFKTAMEISYEDHIKMQAAFQENTDNAVSKTINMPYDTTIKDIKSALLMAYDMGCKGLTIYRDGSRLSQVLISGITNIDGTITPDKRPYKLNGTTYKKKSGCGTLYVTVNKDKDGRTLEIFTHIGKGGCDSQSEAIARIVSSALRSGVKKDVIIEQLSEIRCATAMSKTQGKVKSCPDAIAQALKEDIEIQTKHLCSCGGEIKFENGCEICTVCGLTNCQ